MLIKEVIQNNEPSMKNPQVSIPLDTYNKVAPLIKRQANSAKRQPPLTHGQKLLKARKSKIQQLSNRLKQSEIYNARFKPTETDIVLAMRSL
jgi:hypothetical protein